MISTIDESEQGPYTGHRSDVTWLVRKGGAQADTACRSRESGGGRGNAPSSLNQFQWRGRFRVKLLLYKRRQRHFPMAILIPLETACSQG